MFLAAQWRTFQPGLGLGTGKVSNTAITTLPRLCLSTFGLRTHFLVPWCKFICLCRPQRDLNSQALIPGGALRWFRKGMRIASQPLQTMDENLYKNIAFHASGRFNLALSYNFLQLSLRRHVHLKAVQSPIYLCDRWLHSLEKSCIIILAFQI